MDGNFNAAVYRQRIGELTQRAKHLDRRCTDLTIGESCYLLSLSPQSRTKMGILAAGKDEQDSDPILRIFGNEDGEG